jgi:hypothetical protein
MLEEAVADGDSDASPGGPKAASPKTVARLAEWHALNERTEKVRGAIILWMPPQTCLNCE